MFYQLFALSSVHLNLISTRPVFHDVDFKLGVGVGIILSNGLTVDLFAQLVEHRTSIGEVACPIIGFTS